MMLIGIIGIRHSTTMKRKKWKELWMLWLNMALLLRLTSVSLGREDTECHGTWARIAQIYECPNHDCPIHLRYHKYCPAEGCRRHYPKSYLDAWIESERFFFEMETQGPKLSTRLFKLYPKQVQEKIQRMKIEWVYKFGTTRRKVRTLFRRNDISVDELDALFDSLGTLPVNTNQKKNANKTGLAQKYIAKTRRLRDRWTSKGKIK